MRTILILLRGLCEGFVARSMECFNKQRCSNDLRLVGKAFTHGRCIAVGATGLGIVLLVSSAPVSKAHDEPKPELPRPAPPASSPKQSECPWPTGWKIAHLPKHFVCDAIFLEGDDKPSVVECYAKIPRRTEQLRLPIVYVE